MLSLLEGISTPLDEPQLDAECHGDARRLQQVRSLNHPQSDPGVIEYGLSRRNEAVRHVLACIARSSRAWQHAGLESDDPSGVHLLACLCRLQLQ